MNAFHVRASASLELVPAWLRFLERRQLLETGQRQQTLASLKELHAMFVKLEEAASSLENPAIVEALKAWPGEKEEWKGSKETQLFSKSTEQLRPL